MITRLTGWLALATTVAAFAMAFLYAPLEQTMREAQKIFYVHVPSAWVAYLAFVVVLVGSVAHLWRGGERWDRLARVSAEIGLYFISATLATGMLWGKAVWGTYWTWDARLTTTFILWLIYVAYFLLRRYVEDPDRAARYAAVLGIVGALDIPIIHFSVVWWRTLHPGPAVLRPEGPDLDPRMLQALLVSLLAFTLTYVYFMLIRLRQERLREELTRLRLALAPSGR